MIARHAIFVTGATGVLGARVLKEILLHKPVRVFALVRAKNADEGRERLLKLLQVYDPKLTLQARFNEWVTPVLGDVTLPRMGLSDSDYRALADCTSHTFHIAANTNLFSNMRRMEP